MSISAPFIRRPIGTTLLTIGIGLAGAIGFMLLPVSPLPEVDFPTINVSAGLPGANPETMASSVATPLERQFGHIAGVTEMTSASSLGRANVTLQFDLSRDIDGAARDVQAAINAARSQLPADLPSNPSYRKTNPADAPILMLALTSDSVDKAGLYDIASSILQQKILQVRGVGDVTVGGGALPAVRVEINPTVLNGHRLGLDQVRTFLTSVNANRPEGDLGDDRQDWQLRTTDQLLKAKDYAPLVLKYADGAALKLSDVADVTDSVEDIRTGGLANGKPAVLIIISRQPGANIIGTVDRVRALMPAFQAEIPPSVNLRVMMDRTTTIRDSVRDVEITLAIAIALVIMVVFLFLRTLRSTLIPAVAVPMSLIGTCGVMYLLGFTLDNLSLMALTIATGFVVDDAIVVIENITRHLEAGMGPLEAALQGASEIGFTVISISVSLIAVFIPILLMAGVVGRLFREFAVTLSIAVAISLVISLTTTPMMCAKLLKASKDEKHGRFYESSERFFNWILGGYERSLRWVLRYRALMLVVTLLTMAASVYLYVRIPKGFFPQEDTGRLNGTIQADQDTSFQAMNQHVEAFTKVVMSDPAVESVQSYSGGGGGQNTARMFINLKALSDRKLSADEIIARIRGKAARVPGATLVLQSVQDLRIGGFASAAQYQYTLQGEDVKTLNDWAPRVYAKLRTLPILADVNSNQQTKGLEASLVIDRETASRLGISSQAIDATLYDAFGQRQVSTMYTSLNQYHVIMEVAPAFWQTPDSLRFIYVNGRNGAQVPLSAFTHYAPATAPLTVNHQGPFPAVTISFNLPPGVPLGNAVTAIEDAESQMGVPASIHGSFMGTAEAYQQSLSSTPLLIAAALITVYIVLGVLYESYIHPITILSTLPSAGVGALLALLLTHNELTIIALIGIILLIGIVKKNAIMMIDFALVAERTEGKSSEDAILEACVLRFRPIIMTTMAAMLGGLPLAIGFGTGAELRRPLGVAIVGGLIVSQALTLYTTPVVYLYLDRFRLWWGQVAGRRSQRFVLPPASCLLPPLIAALFLSSCAPVGPNYKRPDTAQPPASFKELPPPDSTLANEWKAAQPADTQLRGNWWEVFGDPALNALEERARTANQNVVQAEAQYRAARASAGAARAELYPTVTAGGGVTVTHPSATRSVTVARSNGTGAGAAIAGTGTITDYQIPVDFSWEPDLWGRIRRTVEAGVATAQASAGDLEAMRLTIEAELATDYFELHGADAQRDLLDQTVMDDQQSLQITTNRFNQGVAAGSDVEQARGQLAAVQAQATDVEVGRAQFEHAIAVLTGQLPAAVTIQPAPIGEMPPAVPLGLPSALVERRPDVAAAERRVAAANANIGVAKAAYFPTVSLSASGGLESSAIGSLLTWPSRFWSLGPSLLQTVFDAGRRHALTNQAVANYDATVAAYRQSVLTSFQDVEDSLSDLRYLSDEQVQQDAAVASARNSVVYANNRYLTGVAQYLEVITAQSTLLENERTSVELLTRRMSASVALVKALGGGWSVAALPGG